MDEQNLAEDSRLFREGEMLQGFVHSEGWKWAKDRLTEKLMDLQSIMNMDDSSPENVILDLKARRMAVELLMSWLRQLEGRADQHQGNKGLSHREEDETIVEYK